MQTINKIVMLYLISSFVATVLTIPLQKQQTHQQHGMSKIIHKRSTTDESPDELPGHDQENAVPASIKSLQNTSTKGLIFSRLDSCSLPSQYVQRICKINHPIPTLIHKYTRHFINKITAQINMNKFETFDTLSYCNSHMLELLCHAYFPRCDSATRTVEYFISTETCTNILDECGGPMYHGRSQQFCHGLMKGRYNFNSCVLPDITNIRTCSLNSNHRSTPSWFQNSMEMADQSANNIMYLLKYVIPSSFRSNTCENSIVNFICDGALFCSSDNQHALTVSSKQKCRDIIKCASPYQRLMLGSICDSYLDEEIAKSF